jgi:hypothetical protein
MSDKDHDSELEIKSLNLDNLDVEELEHRLEMAVIGPPITNGPCNANSCYING